MKDLRFFPVYLALIIWVLWASFMTLTESWHLFADNWFMSVTMALGSFIAGATSEGGGAIAFPVMTLVFDIHPSVARDFSLMIQSVGMTAAALTIIVLKIPVAWRAIGVVSLGGLFGMVIGQEWISPLMTPPLVKLFFTSLWLGFGLVLFYINRHPERLVREKLDDLTHVDLLRLLLVGVIGGAIAGTTGSGIDIVTFSLLVLYFRLCETIATPTSVVLMAISSIWGFLWKEGFSTGMALDAWNYWLVCIPIVVVGAPLGAWFIRTKSRLFIARLLYVSIVIQYLGALYVLPMNMNLVLFSATILAIGILSFWMAVHFGNKRIGRLEKENKK